jgi:hypothetical protein
MELRGDGRSAVALRHVIFYYLPPLPARKLAGERIALAQI